MRYTIFLFCLSILFLQCNRNKNSQNNDASESQRNLIAEHSKEIAETLRDIIENKEPDERYLVLDEELYSSVLIPQFYANRGFENAWIKHHDSLDLVEEFIQYIEAIEHHGLQPEHYHLQKIKTIKAEIEDKNLAFDPNRIAQIDLLLSDAFFMLSSHLYYGKVDAEKVKANWNIRRDKPQLALDKKLEMLVMMKNTFVFMKIFYPQHPGYELMVQKAKELSLILEDDYAVEIAIPEGQFHLDLTKDSLYQQAICDKLIFLGYMDAKDLDSTNQLNRTIEAIKLFQKTHGLNPDGKIGKNTIRALNQPIQDKINALHVNAERLRWMPDSLNKRHILVNIADFTLDFINDRDTILRMRTVVGQDFRQTPVFNARMTYLVLSPTWTVPPTILKNDVIPAVAKNINYLKNKNMKIIDTNGKEIDPTTIDWQKAKARGTIPYRVRQEPGDHNALGRVKFMFPNKYNVYLHDTPSKELFERDSRTFSSGCIRVDKPFELAQLLIGDSITWPADAIKSAMYSGVEKTVSLKKPVDVYIFYLSAWSDGKLIHFRRDVYSRDPAILKALKEKKPV